jgi:aminoglycoside 3-N-acetyltransferase
MAHQQLDIELSLQALGVRAGGVLFVHSSYKSLGAVEGGATAVIAALECALGPSGTLLMPSFNMASRNRTERAASWDRDSTPSSVGYLTEYFRRMEGTLRSDHYSHSVAARGRDAAWITGGHEDTAGWISPWDRSPWGRTYGINSPMLRALEKDASVLMLGVDYECVTYSHVAEVCDYNRRLAIAPAAPYLFVNRHVVGEWWDSCGDVARGRVADAECRLFSARAFVERLVAELAAPPGDFFPSA